MVEVEVYIYVYLCFYYQSFNAKLLWECHCFSSLTSRLELGLVAFFLILFLGASLPVNKGQGLLTEVKEYSLRFREELL